MAKFTPSLSDAATPVTGVSFIDASTVDFAIDYDVASVNELVIGTDYNDSITGSTGDDTLLGGAGADSLMGGAGDDKLVGGSGDDTLIGGTGVDTIWGGAGNDSLTGGVGDDFLWGGEGNDTFVIDSGTDTICDFGAGDALQVSAGATAYLTIVGAAPYKAGSTSSNNGTVYLTSSAASVDMSAATGTGGYVVAATSATTGVALIGSAIADILTGGRGNDTLTGGAGGDTFNINAGIDTVTDLGTGDVLVMFSDTTVKATVAASGFTATSPTILRGTVAFSMTAGLLDLSAATVAANTAISVSNLGKAGVKFVGSGVDEEFHGGAAGDTVDGGAGNDSLWGGAGSDTFTISSGSDIVEDAGSGDVVVVTAGATATLIVLGTAGLTATAATLNSGTASVLSDAKTVDLTLVTGGSSGFSVKNTNASLAKGALFKGSALGDTLLGANGNDTLLGNGGADSLDGGAGNDSLDGGAGADTLTGGAGADTLQVNKADASAGTYTAVGGSVLAPANGDTFAGIDVITDFGAIDQLQLTGVTATLVICTGTLAAGGYLLTSGNYAAGTFTVAGTGADSTLLTFDADPVTAGVQQHSLALKGVLPAQLELMTAAGSVPNVLTLVSDKRVLGSAGNDNLVGGSGNDLLTGVSGNDLLVGGAGNDTLDGGAGRDTLNGGAGNDVFLFNKSSTGTPSSSNYDTIVGFATGADSIDFSDTLLRVANATTAAAGVAAIDITTSIATFSGSDTSVSQQIAAVAAGLAKSKAPSNGGTTPTAATFALWQAGSDAYLFISDDVAKVSAGDVLVKLTNVTLAGVNTIDASGNLTTL